MRESRTIGTDNTAYLSWGFASIIWVLGFVYVSQHGVDSFSSTLSRGIMLFLFNLPIILKDKRVITPQVIKFMVIRHLFMILFGFIFAQCFFYLPINVVHTLYSIGPISVLIMDYLINKVQVTDKQKVGAILAFIGVLLIVNGNYIYGLLGFQLSHQSQFQHYKPEALTISVQLFASLMLFISTFGWATAVILVKKATNVTHYQLNYQLGIIMIMISGLLYQNTDIKQEFRLSLFIKSLLFQGLPLAFGQVFFSNAAKLTKNYGIMTIIGFVGVILSYFLKIFRYKEDLNLLCALGSVLIMFGVSKIVLKD